MNDLQQERVKAFIQGVEYSIFLLEKTLKIFNGYPQNKITPLDIKELLEEDLKFMKDTIEINKKKNNI